MFPNDTKVAKIDTHSAPKSGVLLSASSNTRTVLYGSISCNSTGDYHIIKGSTVTQPNQNNIIDGELSADFYRFTRTIIEPNTPVYYNKQSDNDKCTFNILYVDYDLTQVATSTQIVVDNTSGVSLSQGFTYGEILIIFILILIFTQLFFSGLKEWIFGVRIENPMKNKYNKDL
jgi:hypothetical protein